ncbi:MAG TPA: hypothetical protein DEQ68_01020, partial [Ruminococcaceae bacterium]|nr:hypothetical protein [Oscillospiraceae bacterium]
AFPRFWGLDAAKIALASEKPRLFADINSRILPIFLCNQGSQTAITLSEMAKNLRFFDKICVIPTGETVFLYDKNANKCERNAKFALL